MTPAKRVPTREEIVDAFVADAVLHGNDGNSIRRSVEEHERIGGQYSIGDLGEPGYVTIEKVVGRQMEGTVYHGNGVGNFYEWTARRLPIKIGG